MPFFRGLADFEHVTVRRRNLPHWRQEGATYFVTFRQADSIPSHVMEQWNEERRKWLRRQGIEAELEKEDPARFEEAFLAIPPREREEFERGRARQLHRELDQSHGSCILRQAAFSEIVVEALKFFDGDRLWLGDFVVMPNHVHALLQPIGSYDLSRLLYSIKRYSARKTLMKLRRVGAANTIDGERRSKFWQRESFDRIVRDREELGIYRRYVSRNPLAAGLAQGDFVYFAADWLDAFALRPEAPLVKS